MCQAFQLLDDQQKALLADTHGNDDVDASALAARRAEWHECIESLYFRSYGERGLDQQRRLLERVRVLGEGARGEPPGAISDERHGGGGVVAARPPAAELFVWPSVKHTH